MIYRRLSNATSNAGEFVAIYHSIHYTLTKLLTLPSHGALQRRFGGLQLQSHSN